MERHKARAHFPAFMLLLSGEFGSHPSPPDVRVTHIKVGTDVFKSPYLLAVSS